MNNDILSANGIKEDAAEFQLRFFRCRRLLHFIATRILGDSDRAGYAIRNCWLSACRDPPRFKYEGAFRSWLVRVLMDEALAILRLDQQPPERSVRTDRFTGNSRVLGASCGD